MSVCGIYVRLSEEDKNKVKDTEDSESIKNQKKLLLDYALKSDIEVYDIYSDDNYSGADSSRPEFNRLIKDAKDRKFDTILCKSQSRFSRDMEVIERYVNGLFIEWKIRMIYVTDHIDTSQEGSRKTTQINGLINEWYLEDLSNNVKQTMKSMMKQGKYISSFAPYGYMKDPEDKHHLIIDPPAAEIVRKIFDMYLNGNGYHLICKYLNEHSIPTPSQYKQKTSKYLNGNSKKVNVWTCSTIACILKKEIYVGSIVQHKREKISYKSKKTRVVDESQWVVVKGMHEAIVSVEDFNHVQEIIRNKSYDKSGKTQEKSLFLGKLVCGYCQKNLSKVIGKNNNIYYRCSISLVDKKHCKGAGVSERVLKDEIVKQLKHIIDKYCDELQIKQVMDAQTEQMKYEMNEAFLNAENKIKYLNGKKRKAYLDKVVGNLCSSDYETIADEINKEIHKIRQEMDEIKPLIEIDSIDDKMKFVNKYKEITSLNQGLMNELIDRIEIKNGLTKMIQIHWKF